MINARYWQMTFWINTILSRFFVSNVPHLHSKIHAGVQCGCRYIRPIYNLNWKTIPHFFFVFYYNGEQVGEHFAGFPCITYNTSICVICTLGVNKWIWKFISERWMLPATSEIIGFAALILRELTETFMMISNCRKPFGLHKYFSVVRVNVVFSPVIAFVLAWHSRGPTPTNTKRFPSVA